MAKKIYPCILAIFIFLYVLTFWHLSKLRYLSFFSYEWEDAASANQLLFNLSKGKLFSDNLMIGGSIMGTHTLIFFMLLAVFYALFPHIYMLFFMINTAVAVGAVPVYLISRRILASRFAAFIMACAYLFYAPKHSLNFLDGDPIIFSIPLLLFTFYFALADRPKWALLFGILTMICKTDAALLTFMLSTYFFVKRKDFKSFTLGYHLSLLLSSICILSLGLLINKLFGKRPLVYAFYESSIGGVIHYIFRHPVSFISQMHLDCIGKILLPLLFLPLFSVESYIGLPSFAEVVLTKYFVFQRAHYISGMIPFFFIGTIYSIRKISNFLCRSKIELATHRAIFICSLSALVVLISCIASNFGYNIIGSTYPEDSDKISDRRFLSAQNIFDKRFYIRDEEDIIAWEMVNKIPMDASVSASGDLLVPLSSRSRLLEFLSDEYDYYEADYILIHMKYMYIGAGHYCWDDKKAKIALHRLLTSKDWKLIAKKNSFYLFNRIK